MVAAGMIMCVLNYESGKNRGVHEIVRSTTNAMPQVTQVK